MPDLFAIAFFIIILIIGIFFLIFGLISFKEKRLIENIPTSNIRSIAMGLVEIFGRVVPLKDNILKSPFSDKDCVYYKYRVEELRSSGKNTHWVTIDKGEKHKLFNLEDETGSVLIDPMGAKIDIPIDNKYNSSLGKDPPEAAIRFLATRNIRWEGRIFGINKTMRYSEYFIAPGDKLYIMGTAGDNPYVKEASAERGVEDIMIKKGKFEKFYYISDNQEDAVLFKFKAKTYGGIIIGSILIILSFLVFSWFSR